MAITPLDEWEIEVLSGEERGRYSLELAPTLTAGTEFAVMGSVDARKPYVYIVLVTQSDAAAPEQLTALHPQLDQAAACAEGALRIPQSGSLVLPEAGQLLVLGADHALTAEELSSAGRQPPPASSRGQT